jgi:putative ABC transport system substrate-binding protein
MRRRNFIEGIVGSAVAWPLAARAEQAGRARLIGVQMAYAGSDPVSQSMFAAFRDALAKLGWTEGGGYVPGGGVARRSEAASERAS